VKRLVCLLLCLGLLSGCGVDVSVLLPSPAPPSYTLADLPEYAGEPAVVLNDNIPNFTGEDKAFTGQSFTPLDLLGRCGPAIALVGPETLPEEERGPIGMIKPSGWHTVKYDFIDGKYLYNRCHLIGYQLTGENANEENLVTGTRYLNTQGMLPYENAVADYVRETGNHVLYRATPIFEGADLLCSGVELEGWSVEDEGAGVCFHVYAYNVQPGVVIDYATGESWEADEPTPAGTETVPSVLPVEETLASEPPTEPSPAETAQPNYVLNVKSGKFHRPDCPGAETMSGKNREDWYGDRETLMEQGYTPCGTCKP